MKNYSQNDEQDFILNFFDGRIGTLLEIGAFDGLTFSNTRALMEAGWAGVLVEPDPFNVAKLLVNPVPGTIVVCAAVYHEQSLAMMGIETVEGRGWASTICPRLMVQDRLHKPHSSLVYVPTITPTDLLCRFGLFDFISIDAEGCDAAILNSIPVKMLARCDLLCIEPTDMEERIYMIAQFDRIGFKVCHETPENILACKK